MQIIAAVAGERVGNFSIKAELADPRSERATGIDCRERSHAGIPLTAPPRRLTVGLLKPRDGEVGVAVAGKAAQLVGIDLRQSLGVF